MDELNITNELGSVSAPLRKDGRGGVRAGAGRKRKADRDCKIGFGISVKAKSNLEAYAREQGVSLAEAANMLFEALYP